MIEERWKEILDTNWKVSSEGNIMKPDGKIIHFRSRGYRECELGKVHRIVAYYFCNPPTEANERWVCPGYEVHHKNRQPWDNRASNLEYLTYEEHNEVHKHKQRRNDNPGEVDRELVMLFLDSMRQ